MGLFKKIMHFFLNKNDKALNFEKKIFELETRMIVSEKTIELMASIIAQLADDQGAIAAHVFKYERQDSKNTKSIDILSLLQDDSDDDLIN